MLWELGVRLGLTISTFKATCTFEIKWAEVQASRFGTFQNSNLTPWWQFMIKTILPAVKVF